MWIDIDQSQYCENSRIIIVLKSVSLFLAMEWIFAKSYFNIADQSNAGDQDIVEHRRVPHVCSFYDIH